LTIGAYLLQHAFAIDPAYRWSIAVVLITTDVVARALLTIGPLPIGAERHQNTLVVNATRCISSLLCAIAAAIRIDTLVGVTQLTIRALRS